jgi:hypothetical protein
MDWDEINIRRLHRLFSDKCWKISKPMIDKGLFDTAQQAWQDYLGDHGMRMDVSCNEGFDPGAPRLIVGTDGSAAVRVVNMYGDYYIDVPEEFAVRALALGFLP